MIFKILKGKDLSAQNRLNALALELGEDPNILWYPSAGNDYRDLLEFTQLRKQVHKIEESPDLMIHTDYMLKWVSMAPILYDDGRTRVELENKFEIELTIDIEYTINPNYVDIPEAASPTPLIFLLDVKLTSNTMGTIRKPVLYFMFENINFLDQILLKNKIRISHLVKVREGCGFGGNRKSISIVIDNRTQTDYRLIGILINKYKASPNAYELSLEAVIPRWSGFNVKVFSVNPIERPMHLSQLDDALSLIQREEPIEEL